MPSLDVSDILDDPDFVGSFTLYPAAQTVGVNGRAVNVQGVSVTCAGVITQGTGDVLGRTPEGDIIHGSITIHTRQILSIGDVIGYGGRRHTVSVVNDWSTYGQGYFMAACELLPFNG
jgi:hypothetical protein